MLFSYDIGEIMNRSPETTTEVVARVDEFLKAESPELSLDSLAQAAGVAQQLAQAGQQKDAVAVLTKISETAAASKDPEIAAAVRRVRKRGGRVARAHLHHLNPFPSNTGEVLRRYPKILVPEMNLGQLALLLRAQYLVDAVSYTRVRGRPLSAAELDDAITSMEDA